MARAAARLLERTVPDRSLNYSAQLTQSLHAYVDYVEVNAAGYIALVRGASGVDDHLRQIFEETRSSLAARVTARLPAYGFTDGPAVRLLVRGWIALVEEVVLQWVADPAIAKTELIDVLVGSLPSLLAVGQAQDAPARAAQALAEVAAAVPVPPGGQSM